MSTVESRVLTVKQELFCQKYCESGNASYAYRQAYDAKNMLATTVNRKAAELLKNGKITARVRMMQNEAKNRSEITVDQKRLWLVEIVERTLQHVEFIDQDGIKGGQYKFAANDAIKAISELNKMDGDYAATRREVSVYEKYTLTELLEMTINEK